MALPKQVKYPLTTVELPSDPRIKIKIRPFTGEEEKLFLMLKTGNEDYKKVQETIIQVIGNCIHDAPPKFELKDLCLFDIEWLFLQLHSISIDNTIEFVYNNTENIKNGLCKPDCSPEIKIQIPIADLKVHYPENSAKTIVLYDREDIGMLGIKLKYPTAEMMPLIVDLEKQDESTQLEEMIYVCLESFFDDKQSYVPDRNDPKEVEDTKAMIQGFTFEQRKQIKKFFEEMPTVKHTFNVVCPKCGPRETLTLKGLNDFFL